MHRKCRGSPVITPSQSTGDAHVSLGACLQRTGYCLTQLGHIILELERGLLDGGDTDDTAFKRTQSLQSLDFLKQATDDIAALLKRVADTVPDCESLSQSDVIGPMKLRELREAIGEYDSTDTGTHTLFTGKEIEIF